MQANKRKGSSAAASLSVVRGAQAPKATVFEVMTREVATAFPDMTLASAIEAMVSQDIGHLPVVDEAGVLVGMLSKTDVVREQHLGGETREEYSKGNRMKARGKKGMAYSPGDGFHVDGEPGSSVGDVMSKRVLTVRDDELLADACRLMVNHRIHGVPVVDAKKKLVGFVSTLDVCQWVAGI